MSEYNLHLNLKITANDLAAAYAAVAEVLAEVKSLGEITKVDLSEPKQGNLFGHTSGCRMSDGRRSGTCTCGPVPR